MPIIVDRELRGLYGMMLLLAEYADRMPIVGIQKHFAAVIPAQAGIQKLGFTVIFKYF